MVTCSLDGLKKSSKRKEMRMKKLKVEVLPQTIGDRKGKDQDDEFLGG